MLESSLAKNWNAKSYGESCCKEIGGNAATKNDSIGILLKEQYENFTAKSRECRSYKKSSNKEQGKLKKECAVEISLFQTLVSYDGLGGYDWSEGWEGPNYALMDFLISKF
ncbi:hypothetical protein Tco_1430345 [Tanacetum coccineum]